MKFSNGKFSEKLFFLENKNADFNANWISHERKLFEHLHNNTFKEL